MMGKIDNLLNKITMYRVIFYELVFIITVSLIISAVGKVGALSFSPEYLIFSVIFIFSICWIINKIFASSFNAPSNPESTWITVLILILIITPPTSFFDTHFLSLAFWASGWSIASKYIFALYKKHLFNPVAFGIAVTAIFLGVSASWWVGTMAMTPFIIIGGLLVVKKIKRMDLWWSFFVTITLGMIYSAISGGTDVAFSLNHLFFHSPAFFFATIMLTEPLTTPPTRLLRIMYGIFVGVLFLPNTHIGSFYFTPEIALLVGNIFSYLISPKGKYILRLSSVEKLSPDVYEFAFTTKNPINYKPGQYMEWTLAHNKSDSRGFRRYFTLSSSPTENLIKLGIKYYQKPSTFKDSMLSMGIAEPIVASQLAGDFTLPRNKNKKLVFIAGGIGVTPFRSMIKYLIDIKERRDIVLLYANKTQADVVYKNIFDQAKQELGIRIIYAFTDKGAIVPPDCVSKVNSETIAAQIPDYLNRTYYISGPHGMVVAFEKTLHEMGIENSSIKTDYFTGFA